MLKREFLEEHEDGVIFYRVYSDRGMEVLQVETGIHYGEVAITDDDPYTYVESDTPTDPDEEITAEELLEELEEIL